MNIYHFEKFIKHNNPELECLDMEDLTKLLGHFHVYLIAIFGKGSAQFHNIWHADYEEELDKCIKNKNILDRLFGIVIKHHFHEMINAMAKCHENKKHIH